MIFQTPETFRQELDPAIYIAEELEQLPDSSLQACEREFKAKGGKLVVFQKDSDQIQGCFTLFPEDVVYPICSAGNCRSQVLYHILRPLAEKGSFRLHPPHAARTGYDPYHGRVPIQFYDQQQDEFVKAFDHPKVQQFGFAQIQQLMHELGHLDMAETHVVATLKNYYNQHFYAPSILRPRVYIPFRRPVHAVLKRLNETNKDLSWVTLVAIPLDDEITKVPSHLSFRMRSVEAYKYFEAKLSPLFKLS